MDDPQINANPYLALGVRPFINCCSVRTVQGGSLMLPQVRTAMAAASRHFVNLDELMEAASARIAELTGAEWGIVTCGSAAAVALGTAACVAGNDPVKMLRLPFTEGWPNKVIMARNQRFAYDQAIRMIGTHIVEIDTPAEFEAALDDTVAMIAVLGTDEHHSAVRIEQMAERARPRGIPILVDAASEHIEKPSPWFARGADLVVYSGGKFLRGPQTSGLLLGRKDLVQAAWRNASPHQALGRPMKVSKEDVIGLLTALEYWMEARDLGAEQARWRADIAAMAAVVGKLPGITTATIEPAGVVRVPCLRITWDATARNLTGEQLRQRLTEGEPRIMVDDLSAGVDNITLDPFGLQPGEAAAVGRAIAAALTAPPRAEAAPPPPARDLSGEWTVNMHFLHGTRTHTLHLTQSGNSLTGHQTSPQFEGPVRGALEGHDLHLAFEGRYEGNIIRYALEGTAEDGTLSGIAILGTANDHHQGSVNLAQFGTASWTAARR